MFNNKIWRYLLPITILLCCPSPAKANDGLVDDDTFAELLTVDPPLTLTSIEGERFMSPGTELNLTLLGPQTAILGNTFPTIGATPSQPCGAVPGCAAAFSLQRRVVPAWTGNLLQLTRTGGGGGSQNIGQVGTNVDSGTINTFCGSNNANGCVISGVYDQSGNGCDLTVINGNVTLSWVGVWGSAPNIRAQFGSNNFFDNGTCAQLHTGNTDKAIFAVVNDGLFSDCCGIFGQAHTYTDMTDKAGTDFMVMVRASKVSDIGDAMCRRVGIDLEIDVAEQCYGVDVLGSDSLLASYQAQSSFGDFTVLAMNTASTGHVFIDWNATYSTDLLYQVGLSCSNSTLCDNHIRVGAGGDGSTVFGYWYEGLIYAQTLTSIQRTTLDTNAQAYYNIPTALITEVSGKEGILTTLGESNMTALWGLRRDNLHITGPLGIVQRADTTFHVIKPSGTGIDAADLASFCNTTCHVVILDNQVMASRNWVTCSVMAAGCSPISNYASAHADPWRLESGGPTYNSSCSGGLQCMTFASSDKLGSHTTMAWPAPYSLIAVGSNTTSGTFGGLLSSGTGSHPYLGRGSPANSALFQADDSTGAVTCTSCATDGTPFVFGGEAVSGSTSALFVNGTETGPNSVTVTNSTVQLIMGGANSFTGTIYEGAVSVGQAISAPNMSTVSSKLRSYWGI